MLKKWLLAAIVLAVLNGCSENNNAHTGSSSSAEEQTATGNVEDVDLEVWSINGGGFQPIRKGSKMYELYKQKLGVGVIQPYVEWNGGTTYLNQLNLKIAANEMPDLFMPWQGVEASLAKTGAIADLTDLLPEYAPNVWKSIPQDVWNIVKANDPGGEGRIYYIPNVVNYGRTAGLIRQDWLDKVEMPMPTTQEEYVQVLEAFRDKDPNGNGQKDEIPTGGREQVRWMDHLFAMYGVAMYEGYPDWDLYDGKLTYSAVTPNMKAALEFAAKLYKDGLMDKESLLNTGTQWNGKIDSNRVGNYYHWSEAVIDRLEPIKKNTGVEADYTVLPIPKVEGYEGFYTWKRIQNPAWVVKNNKDKNKTMATLKLLNNLYDEKNWNDLYLGVEGMHHTITNGKATLLPDDKSTMENKAFKPWEYLSTLEFSKELYQNNSTESRAWAINQNVRNMEETQKYVKLIAGDGLPASIYDGFPDISNRTLYLEYASKIILGQLPISKFDEFVEKWNKSGGEEVTKRANDWYKTVHK